MMVWFGVVLVVCEVPTARIIILNTVGIIGRYFGRNYLQRGGISNSARFGVSCLMDMWHSRLKALEHHVVN